MNILFVQEPSGDSTQWLKLQQDDKFNIVKYILQPTTTTKETFIQFLNKCEQVGTPINAIFAGFPAFHPIGGLTQDIIDLPVFHKNVKCLALCSRGVNFIDLDALSKYNIKLFHYDDSQIENITELNGISIELNQVGNDVADCAMWHVLEGFRKFSYFMQQTTSLEHSIKSRQVIRGEDDSFAFGHELNKGQFVISPRNKKALILGMGSIGRCIATKLQFGLNMEIHYTKRSGALQDDNESSTWIYHPMDSLTDQLYMFDAIVVALPGTPETFHSIDSTFLSYCKKDNLILVNVGRASVFEMEAISKSIANGQIRHLGMDVFTNEPLIDSCLLDINNQDKVTYTPHIGSGTKQVFDQSTDLAISQLCQWLLPSSQTQSD